MVTMKPAFTNVVTMVDDFSSVGDSDGAHSGSMPVVECAYATIGQPSSGGLPGGTKTEPDTCSVPPVMPDVEVYSMRAASEVAARSLRSIVGSVVASDSAPGSWPAPL